MLNPVLKLLIEMQDIDDQIADIEKNMKEREQEIRRIEEQTEEVRYALDLIEHEHKVLKEDRKSMENELEDSQANEVKSRKRIGEARNQRESEAARRELENIRKDRSELETRTLETIERVEHLDGEIAEKRKTLEELETARNHEVEERRPEIEKLTTDIAKMEKEKDIIKAETPAEIVANYDRLIIGRGRRAMAPVVNGACTLCNVRIQPQLHNQVLAGREIYNCPSCQRFIYIEPEIEGVAE